MKTVIKFLQQNGYIEDSEPDAEYRTFYKGHLATVDINDSEIVLIGEQGDFCHLPVNVFALLGALLHYKQIAINYNL